MLTRKLQLFRKQDKPVTEYVTGFKAICDELAAIGKPLTDDDKVFWLVNGLGPGYESFMTSILKPSVPPYLDVVSLLQGHETMRDLHAGETRLNSQMAFFTRQSNSQNNRRRYNNNWRNNNTNPRFNSKGQQWESPIVCAPDSVTMSSKEKPFLAKLSSNCLTLKNAIGKFWLASDSLETRPSRRPAGTG
ncbi:hypothetical protein EJ110_NYTH53395 [Nymphaea thermarum]|nr:hypothetical protein EJ110_NYTH53395 [Nymphaea thermarum]